MNADESDGSHGSPAGVLRGRRPPLLRLALWLMTGAILNVAVAWGFFVWRPGEVHRADLDKHLSDEIWNRFNAPASGSPRNGGSVDRINFNRFFYEAHAKDFSSGSNEVVELGGGWPMTCLIGQCWDHGEEQVHCRFNAPRGRLLDTRDFQADIASFNALPGHPLRPGVAVNTLFYTEVLCVLFAGPFRLRRSLRRRRGRCAA